MAWLGPRLTGAQQRPDMVGSTDYDGLSAAVGSARNSEALWSSSRCVPWGSRSITASAIAGSSSPSCQNADRRLAHDDRRAQAGTVLGHPDQVGGPRVGAEMEREVVVDEDVSPGPAASRRGSRPSTARRQGPCGSLAACTWYRAVPRPDCRSREAAARGILPTLVGSEIKACSCALTKRQAARSNTVARSNPRDARRSTSSTEATMRNLAACRHARDAGLLASLRLPVAESASFDPERVTTLPTIRAGGTAVSVGRPSATVR